MSDVLLGPSILAANFHCLADEIAAVESAGVDFIHLDIMDGRYVPEITFGPLIVKSVRTLTERPLDVHLMIEQPERHLESFVGAGADMVTVHVEPCVHLHAVLTEIRMLGASPGVALNPATPLETAFEVLEFVDQVLVMSVNPGFGGQTLIPTALRRIERMREGIERVNPKCMLEVDGGIKASNIAQVVNAGANMIVAGSAIFSPDAEVAEAVRQLREAIGA